MLKLVAWFHVFIGRGCFLPGVLECPALVWVLYIVFCLFQILFSDCCGGERFALAAVASGWLGPVHYSSPATQCVVSTELLNQQMLGNLRILFDVFRIQSVLFVSGLECPSIVPFDQCPYLVSLGIWSHKLFVFYHQSLHYSI